jgi:hypothetical protein
MRSLLRSLRARWKLLYVRRLLDSALGLHRRLEARADGLTLVDYSMKLIVRWRARNVHPWDRDLPDEQIAPRLVDQSLHDAEDAVERIFRAFPEASALELNVFESDPASNRVIMSGLVIRSNLGRSNAASIRMRLRMPGIEYRLVNQRFEAIATGELPQQPTTSGVERDFQLDRPIVGVQRPAHSLTKSRTRWPESDDRSG